MKDNEHNSLLVAQKCAWVFVLEYYLPLKAHSFPRATLQEKWSLLGTGDFYGQISEHTSAPNGGYCLSMFTVIIPLVRIP